MNDVIGFAAILGAGAYGGYKYGQSQPFGFSDFLIIGVLLLIGFYFAVILS
jgi:hypothetical protein